MPNRLLVRPPAPLPPLRTPRVGALRPVTADDLEPLGDAYWRSYGGAQGETSRDEAVEDVVRAWDGGYGPLLRGACAVAEVDRTVVGGVLTVSDAPWPDVPRGPFVIDLFVVPEHRGRGLGEALMHAALAGAGEVPVGLRVEDDAVVARALYARLGFT